MKIQNIKLMPDYQCYPIWDTSPGKFGNVNPNDLPISQELKNRLSTWAQAFNATLNMEYPPDSGFESEKIKQEFREEGLKLAEQLQRELGTKYVVEVKLPQ